MRFRMHKYQEIEDLIVHHNPFNVNKLEILNV